MFNILIADDEKYIRKGVISIIEKNINVEINFWEAPNGIKALEIVEVENIDLIITDISMPGCDGLQFVEKLREKNNQMTVVILSGYENFQYAQQAIRLGVKEYLMKPVKKNEFIIRIQEYIEEILENKAKRHEKIIKKRENYKILERLKRDSILGFLNCPSSEEAKKYLVQLSELGITLESKLYACAVVQYKVEKHNREYMDFAMKNILDEYLKERNPEEFLLTVNYDVGRIVVIFEGDNKECLGKEKQKLLRDVAQVIKKIYDTPLYIGLGDVAFDSIQLHIALRHALLALDYKVFDEGDIVSSFEMIRQNVLVLPINMGTIVKTEDIFKILDAYQALFMKAKSKEGIRILRKEYEEFSNYVNRQLVRRGYLADVNEGIREFHECWTIQELKQSMKEQFDLMNELQKSPSINISFIKQVISYVDEHITEEIDLTMVAEYFNRTPGYISMLFKKHIEGGFNNYITNERMIIAKKLLVETSGSIQEISEMCGYPNSKYFSVVFKKNVGETPREFRDRNK